MSNEDLEQLYLACLYGLIPIFPAKVQDEVLPVVSLADFAKCLPQSHSSCIAPISAICPCLLHQIALVADHLPTQLPLWAIVTLGAYLLGNIGYSLLTFNDVPKAYDSLMKEIETAKKDLRAKGVTVD